MPRRNSFYQGMLAGMLFCVAAQAGNWLITPITHPNSSTARVYGVVAQGVLCLGAALWLVFRERSVASLRST
jgi:hypothetical protein